MDESKSDSNWDKRANRAKYKREYKAEKSEGEKEREFIYKIAENVNLQKSRQCLVKVQYSDICKSELRSSDHRAAINLENIF